MKRNKAKKTGLIHSANQNRQDFSVVLMPYNANRKKTAGWKLEMQAFTLVTRLYESKSKVLFPFAFQFLLKSAILTNHLAHFHNTRGSFQKGSRNMNLASL